MNSAPSPELTDEEIARITRPLTQGAARCRYFARLGLPVKPRPNGQPLVGRAAFDACMSSLASPAANDGQGDIEIDFTSLRDRVAYGRGTKAQRRQPPRP